MVDMSSKSRRVLSIRIEMSDALELANVDRVKALIAIAQLRGCDVKDVMKSLGISVHG
jgi:hypothetical protein